MQKLIKVKKGVIVAAGLGTRFLPASKAVPKELLPVLDKPVIQYLAEEMAGSGIKEIIMVISPQKQAIIQHFKRDLALEKLLKKTNKQNLLKPLNELLKKVKFTFVYQNQAKGNGHALLCAKKAIGNEPFAFSDGDSIIDGSSPAIGQVIKVFEKLQAPVIGVQRIKDKKEMTKYGNVYADKSIKSLKSKVHKVLKIVEKPSVENVSKQGLIVGGMRYVFDRDIWPILENLKPSRSGEIWVADAANTMAQTIPFYAYEYEGKYFDTGSKVTLLKTANYFAKKEKLV